MKLKKNLSPVKIKKGMNFVPGGAIKTQEVTMKINGKRRKIKKLMGKGMNFVPGGGLNDNDQFIDTDHI